MNAASVRTTKVRWGGGSLLGGSLLRNSLLGGSLLRSLLLGLLLCTIAMPACDEQESGTPKTAKQKAASGKKKPTKKAKAALPRTEADFEVSAAKAIGEDNYAQALTNLEEAIRQEQALVRAVLEQEQAKLTAQSPTKSTPAATEQGAPSPAAAKAGKLPSGPATNKPAISKPATSKSALKPAPSSVRTP